MSDIKKDTFIKADSEMQRLILFDFHKATYETLEDIKKILEKHPTDCEKRFKALEDKNIKNTLFAGGSGLTGGFFAVLGKKFGWW